MALQRNGYYYDAQLKRYILQFMAVFSGLQVQVGKWNDVEERLISVPIHYGHQDRIVASILADNTQNKVLRLPMMSAYMRTLEVNTTHLAGTGTERRNAYTPVGGEVTTDTQVIYQRRPVPYKLGMEVVFYASNTDQMFQMIEQIAPIFGPTITIPAGSDAPFDWQRLSAIDHVSTVLENNYPSGTDRRMNICTMNFDYTIWIGIPADVRKNFIEKIFLRIGALSENDLSNYEIVADLDAQGIPYELVQDASDLKID